MTFFESATGGSLGWKIKGSLDPTFEEVAFSLEPSTTSNPKIGEAKTPFGYHIIMVSFERLFPLLDISGTWFITGFIGRGAEIKNGQPHVFQRALVCTKEPAISDDSLNSFFIFPVMQDGHDTRPRVQP